MSSVDKIVDFFLVSSLKGGNLILGTNQGKIKKVALANLKLKNPKKLALCFKLKLDENIIGAKISHGNALISFLNQKGYATKFGEEEIKVSGPKSAGIKGINLGKEEAIAMTICWPQDNLLIFYHQKGKIFPQKQLKISSRTSKGQKITTFSTLKLEKTIFYLAINKKDVLNFHSKEGTIKVLASNLKTVTINDKIKKITGKINDSHYLTKEKKVFLPNDKKAIKPVQPKLSTPAEADDFLNLLKDI